VTREKIIYFHHVGDCGNPNFVDAVPQFSIHRRFPAILEKRPKTWQGSWIGKERGHRWHPLSTDSQRRPAPRKDDVADAARYAKTFHATRIIHRSDSPAMPDAEWFMDVEPSRPNRNSSSFRFPAIPQGVRPYCITIVCCSQAIICGGIGNSSGLGPRKRWCGMTGN
jgi:hypothetical protein